ncbi:MAG: hypothetical protein ACYS8Z_09395 [Planctomycetota bacterium]|jgi:predicted enzyme involved in methoxymalonyl-ACP biosynthesis
MIVTEKKRIKPIVMVWLGSLAVLAATFLIFLMPQERAKAQLARQLNDKEEGIARARETASESNREKLEKEIQALEDVMDDFIMNHTSSANLAFAISRISKNLKIRAFSLTNTDREGFAKVAGSSDILAKPVNLSFRTSFNTFAAFLNALERCRPAIFADTFRITNIPSETGGRQVDMKLLVLVSDHANKGNSAIGTAKLTTK